MKLKADWHQALEAARRGDLGPAEAARGVDAGGAVADYFYARCLTEARERLPEAEALLREALRGEPSNLIVRQTLALTLALEAEPAAQLEAGRLWTECGLPHATDLLGSTALTLEARLRAASEDPAAASVPWPKGLQDPGEAPASPAPVAEEPEEPMGSSLDSQDSGLPGNPDAGEAEKSDILSLPDATKPTGFFHRRQISRTIDMMERWLMEHQPVKILEHALLMLNQGFESPDLHLAAGIAAEETGLIVRARAHLARAIALDPRLIIARSYLGRVYWHAGWYDLALAMLRTLPVEGPYDYGRHYLLALTHEGLGDRTAARAAMDHALTGFFYDTRHFYVERAFRRWMRLFGGEKARQSPAEKPGGALV